MERVLALDMGTKRTGLALSDPLGISAQGLGVLHRTTLKEDLAAVEKLIHDHDVKLLVIGLPRNMDGSYGPAAERIRYFAEELRKHISIPIHLQDERLTTAQAQKVLIEGHMRREKRKEVIDKQAAVLILQQYLDQHHYSSPE